MIGQITEDTDELAGVFTRFGHLGDFGDQNSSGHFSLTTKFISRFVKERGDLEKEYAKGLRKLVGR